MDKHALLQPLIPFGVAHNFPVGDPLNGRAMPHEGPEAACRAEGYDYSGADRLIQYPRDWHVCVGFGGKAGGFHQDCAPGRFQPHRVQVVSDPNPEKPRRVLRCLGGTPGNPGKFELAKWFTDKDGQPAEVRWADGQPLLAEFVFMPSSEVPGKHYLNFELRGLLNFKAAKNEAVQCFGVHLNDHSIMAAYWRDAKDGSRVDEDRMEVRTPSTLRLDRWHRLSVHLVPQKAACTWRVSAQIAVQQQVVWGFESDERNDPNNIEFVSQLCFGDERERDETGGLWYIARAMCYGE